MSNKNIITLTNDNFYSKVLNSKQLVLVDFWAPWCGPCRMLSPIMHELASNYKGKVKIAKVNVDKESFLAGKYRVMSLPTILFFKDGNIVEEVVGFQSKRELKIAIENNL